MGQETPKNTYVTLHKNFVRTDIEYADRRSGEVKTFNSVTLPKGTVIDGRDVSERLGRGTAQRSNSPMSREDIPF